MPPAWLTPAWLTARLPPRTVRLRLAAAYGALFLASAAAMLAVTYALVDARPALALSRTLTRAQVEQVRDNMRRILSGQRPTGTLRALVAEQRADTLHQLVLAGTIALIIMALVSAWLGWLVAGRGLSPLRMMTFKARQISGQNLHERLALPGPDDELKNLGDTFDGLLARLEAAFAAERQFVANASHELRTPLTLERAMVEVALADPDAPAAALRATCERVLAASAQQERILDALLTLARGQRGLDEREPLDLEMIAEVVLDGRLPDARRRGLRVDVSLYPAPASGDPALAERLIANLVENAVVHNIDGGWLRVATSLRAGRSVLQVASSGPVIDPGQVDRLLRPFERLGADRTGKRAGLGLAIVAAIAAAHDAALELTALPAGGLQAEVRFPAVAPA